MSSENMNPTQSSLYLMQHAALRSYTINQLERLNFQPSFTPRNGILNKQQQYQQPPRQIPQPEHYVQQKQAQLKLQNQQPLNLVNNDGFGQRHISGMQTQFGQRTSEYFTKDDPFLSFQPVHNAQTSHQMLHPHHLTSQPENNSIWPSVGTQSNCAHESQWNSQSQDINHIAGNTSKEQLVQSNFHQHILSKDKAQFNNLSSDPSIVVQSVEPQESANTTNNIHLNQQRWLLLMFHARRCVAPEGQCPEKKCASAQKLCKHIDNCNLTPHYCSYPCCYVTKRLLYHFKNCKDPCCPVCVAVRNFPRRYLKCESQIRPINISGMPIAANESYKSYDSEFQSHSLIRKRAPAIENSEDHEPSRKRLKFEHSNSGASSGDTSMVIESEPIEVKEVIVQMENENLSDVNKSDTEDVGTTCEPVAYNDLEPENAKTENETAKDKSASMTQKFENALGTKSDKPKIKVVSMIEQFPPELVRQHITSLKQWTSQNKARAKKHQAKKQSMSQNLCQLCDLGKLDFNIPPIDCSICSFQLKRNVMYYYTCISHKHHYVCTQCYKKADGDIIVVDGTRILKGSLEKWKNDEEVEEGWVQCDECQAWQHQICALFNGKRNVGGEAEYICPYCYIEEVERGERIPLHENAIPRAKDLPRTILSDHLEERLFTKLKHERQERARVQGKSYDEVPGAEQLVIRVVSSVDKKLEVKQRFLEIFQEENYPTEFPYKSKVILLFQMIEGVEVLLFGMYVQEYGTECHFPNQRRVYLSYLDSVKYFQPEIKTTTGEALRTFVYHEIIIGYLEYCKKRGFTSCYIWVCPPFKGDDYILYCHPEIQKTPKLDKLREWYLSMLRKAAEDDIVVDLTNLYDHFFVSTGECRAKVTAARLPYFDGDYWPGAAEDLIHLLSQEEDGRKQNKKGTIKKTITNRALKASSQTDLSGNASKDLHLMNKLGKAIGPMKKDFIMVHLQHACNHCCLLMVSGNRWVCNQCKNFQICDKCYEAEQSCEERERHPINQQEKHFFNRIEISGVPSDIKDKDEILESEFLDTRQAFLSHCQENHYQFDNLRRAKHSSMMLIDLLHNPTASAFMQYSQRNWSSSTCNLCSIHIETTQGWRCETCPDFDVCNACYQKGVVDHQHKLTKYPSLGGDSQSKEARQQQVLQIREILVLLLHASQCRTQCLYPSCRKMKVLFRHVTKCEIHASGGCSTCKMVWKMLHIHARTCKESHCHVPRCRVIREHLGKLQQQSESQQRKTVNEVIRERAAEAANNAQ